VSVETWNYW